MQLQDFRIEEVKVALYALTLAETFTPTKIYEKYQMKEEMLAKESQMEIISILAWYSKIALRLKLNQTRSQHNNEQSICDCWLILYATVWLASFIIFHTALLQITLENIKILTFEAINTKESSK